MRNLSRAFVSICLRMLTAVGIATSSVVGDAVYDNEIGWTPQPTGAMGLPFHDWLNKRQNDAPTSVCGYIASGQHIPPNLHFDSTLTNFR